MRTLYETVITEATGKLNQETKLICPYCGCETTEEYEDGICCMCGSEMAERKLCPCCDEYNIPEHSTSDYCTACKESLRQKLYKLLKANFTETEIDILDEVADSSFFVFLNEFEGGKEKC